MTPLSIFWCCFVSLIKPSFWSKFHGNIITGSGVMTIFFYKWLTRNPKIGNTPIWALPNAWGLERVRDTKFGMDVSSEMLLNVAKCQGYSIYHFWVINWKPTCPSMSKYFNQSLANAPNWYPLKRPENQSFCHVFRGYKRGCWVEMA